MPSHVFNLLQTILQYAHALSCLF